MKTDGRMKKGETFLFSFNRTMFQLFRVLQGMLPEPPVGYLSTEIENKESEQVLGQQMGNLNKQGTFLKKVLLYLRSQQKETDTPERIGRGRLRRVTP